MAEIKIRALKKSDIDAIAKIQEAITKKKVPKYWAERVIDYIKKTPKACLAAEYTGKIVGFIIGDIKTWGFGIERSGWIELVGVAPEFMGRGVGKKLGKTLIQHFEKEGIKEVYTTVRWDSGDLLAFFKSIGFTRSNFINLEKRLRG
ncbi:MAG: GNAT family N-acetyltransferase [Candidatus Thermoplasmatota archaeon]|nr:GNAT family N-acetyltransferase [Candidatus Thermoplasmatota archaeon]MDI6856109.1 GNAT family N-acetyltransferase [Candidatus Thermoplasmatota archaeon]